MLRTVLLFWVALLFGASVSAQEPTPGDRVFTVSAFIYENGELLGMPSFTVQEGNAAAVATRDGEQYALEVRIAPPSEEQLAAFGNTERLLLNASTQVFVPDLALDEWRVIATPQMLVSDGQRSRVEIDTSGQDYRRDGAQDYIDEVRIDLIVTEVDETWFDQADSEKSLKTCSIDQIEGPKSLALSAAVVQVGGFPTIGDGDCCSNGCLTCCGSGPTCCADPANCASGCCTG